IMVVTTSHGRELRQAFAGKIRREPAITLAYGVTGDVDAVLHGNFIDAEECQAVCDRLFDDDPHIVRYTTLFAVERYKEETAIPSDALAAKLAER
ncbi:Lrp/AsnC family transcriptional regulator, partial [Mesorhizobium sp. M00.F.Ca.ET.038.03.1.1]